VVHSPWGGHPSPVPGCYNRDHQAFIDYRNESKTPELFAKWQNRWVDRIHSFEEYRVFLGQKRMDGLEIKTHDWSEPVDYGY